MLDLLITSLRAYGLYIFAVWVMGYLYSKVNGNLYKFPKWLAILCGYPHKGNLVNFLAACYQIAAFLMVPVGMISLYIWGQGKSALAINVGAMLLMPLLVAFLLRGVTVHKPDIR
jgi:hypothetical protein